jgi:predicted dehydrogenase
MLHAAPIDAVLVTTPHHINPALHAIDAGKHVLIEKPLCYEPTAARELVAMAHRADVTVMVGYQKRHDASFIAGIGRLRGLDRIRMSRVHDFAGRYGRDTALFGLARPGSDLPADRDPEPSAEDAVCRLAPPLRSLHERMLRFACHDLSVARAAFGEPADISSAHLIDDTTVLAVLSYHSVGPCVLELSLATHYEWFDESITVFGDEEQVRVQFADPFIPYARSELSVMTAGPFGGWQESRLGGSFEDAFRREWRHFASCIRDGSLPVTDLESALADVELMADIFHTIKDVPRDTGA